MVRNSHIYTIEELRQLIASLLAKYDMAQAHLFGSYARCEADEASDKDVDVYELSELNPGSFRDAVTREMVRL